MPLHRIALSLVSRRCQFSPSGRRTSSHWDGWSTQAQGHRRAQAREHGERPEDPRVAAQTTSATKLDGVLEKKHEVLDEGRIAATIEVAPSRAGHAFDAEQLACLARTEQRLRPATQPPGHITVLYLWERGQGQIPLLGSMSSSRMIEHPVPVIHSTTLPIGASS